MRLPIAVMLCIFMSGSVAMARVPVNQRQVGQRNRIVAGALSGTITGREAAQLSAQQQRIQGREFRDRVDGGRFTPKERAKTQRRLNNASQDIYRQKHDGQTR